MTRREGVHDALFWQGQSIDMAERERLSGHKAAVLWFTGLSGSGKSTMASAVERRLYALACRTFVLEFSSDDRHENIRRVGEVASLFVQSGAIVLSALISPFAADRERARSLVPAGRFFEIYCNASVEDCERRDVKGLYRRARSGEVRDFSGISSPYEAPDAPDLVLHTARDSVELCVEQVLAMVQSRLRTTASC